MKVFTLKPYNAITEPQYKKVIAFLTEISNGENVDIALAKITAATFDPPSPMPTPKKTKKTNETIVLNSDKNDTVAKIENNIISLITLSEPQLKEKMEMDAPIENSNLGYLTEILESISTTFSTLNEDVKNNMKENTNMFKDVDPIIFQDNSGKDYLKTVSRLKATKNLQEKYYPPIMSDVMMPNEKLYYNNYYEFEGDDNGKIVRNDYLRFIESYIFLALMILNNLETKKLTNGLLWIKTTFKQNEYPTRDMHFAFFKNVINSRFSSNGPLQMEICSALEMIEKNHVYIDAAGNYDAESIETNLIEPLRNLIGDDNQQLTELFGLYTKGSLQRLSTFDKDTQTRYLHCLSSVAGALTENRHKDQEFIDECYSQWPFKIFSLTEGQVLHV
jgi:hypothetical protein